MDNSDVPISGVGIGLGKNPGPSVTALTQIGGTAEVWYDLSNFQLLVQLVGRTFPTWSVVYPANSNLSANAPNFGSLNLPGTTTIEFSPARILSVQRQNGAVVLTLSYQTMSKAAVASTAAGAQWTLAVTKSLSNIKNN